MTSLCPSPELRGLRIQRSLKSYLLTSIVNRLRNIAKSGRRDFSPLPFRIQKLRTACRRKKRQ